MNSTFTVSCTLLKSTWRAVSLCSALVAVQLALIPALHAAIADDSPLAVLKSADEKRVAAMKSPDRERLSSIFSDDLQYAHSTGTVDTKASFTDLLMSGKTKYVGYDYEERRFTFPAPGIALMSGRVHVTGMTATGEMDNWLSFLAVWREENGHWRFLAWQSCKISPTKAP